MMGVVLHKISQRVEQSLGRMEARGSANGNEDNLVVGISTLTPTSSRGNGGYFMVRGKAASGKPVVWP